MKQLSGIDWQRFSEITNLPIYKIISAVLQSLARKKQLIIQAMPGAGKTTIVPLTLLEQEWAINKKIILLEPRRLAARMAAKRMASLLGEKVGQTVGFRIRGDTMINKNTRIEVMTDGLFLRYLLGNPDLENIAAVIFDEFHERRVDSDLGLSLLLSCQQVFRPDIRLIIMSATLDLVPLQVALPEADVIFAEGKTYPVATYYLAKMDYETSDDQYMRAVNLAWLKEHGDILFFLPGVSEIRRLTNRLQESHLLKEAVILQLYADLPEEKQYHVLNPTDKRRRIILATSIAETSITIPGVRIVIDSGLSRQNFYHQVRGVTELQTLKSSLAVAEQRAGRAGRTEPGVCYRLWSTADHKIRIPHHPPEINLIDLSHMLLLIHAWGSNIADLVWVTKPSEHSVKTAHDTLLQIGAMDKEKPYHITPYGMNLASFGVHPRLAHVLLRSKELNIYPTACLLVAFLSERDFLKPKSLETKDINVLIRLKYIRTYFQHKKIDENPNFVIDFGILNLIAKMLDELISPDDLTDDIKEQDVARLIAIAYPHQVASRRVQQDKNVKEIYFLLANGQGARLPATDPLARHQFLAVAQLDASGSNAQIFLAAPLPDDFLKNVKLSLSRTVDDMFFSPSGKIQAKRCRFYGDILVDEMLIPFNYLEEAFFTNRICELIMSARHQLNWTEDLKQWIGRVEFLRKHDLRGGWPSVGQQHLLETLPEWFIPHIDLAANFLDLKTINIQAILANLLDWQQQKLLSELVPSFFYTPAGRTIKIDYQHDKPILAARIQDLFGCSNTPTILNGRFKLLLHLLAPSGRSVQITDDLAGFWNSSYHSIRNELRGRYPKHAWPEQPW